MKLIKVIKVNINNAETINEKENTKLINPYNAVIRRYCCVVTVGHFLSLKEKLFICLFLIN